MNGCNSAQFVGFLKIKPVVEIIVGGSKKLLDIGGCSSSFGDGSSTNFLNGKP